MNWSLVNNMRVVERLVGLGRAARENAKLRVRQPLASAQFATRDAAEAEAVRKLADIIKSELNVKEVKVLEGAGDVVAYALNPLPSVLGKKLGKDFPAVQKTLRGSAQTDGTRRAETLSRGENVTVGVNGQNLGVTPEQGEVKQQ